MIIIMIIKLRRKEKEMDRLKVYTNREKKWRVKLHIILLDLMEIKIIMNIHVYAPTLMQPQSLSPGIRLVKILRFQYLMLRILKYLDEECYLTDVKKKEMMLCFFSSNQYVMILKFWIVITL